jgi:Putative DNA-binding domain
MNQLAPLSFRLIDQRGRIAALDAEADGMAVRVEEGIEGGLAGFHLHLLWRAESDDNEWSRSERALSGTENLSLATDGVPAELVAVLIDPAGEEVDRRVFDRRFQILAEDPETLEASVVRWIEEGEHAELEYKRELNEKANRSFAETVAAFANGGGGAILIGIDDDGTTIGWGTQKPLDRVTDIVAGLVEEMPVFQVDEVRIEGKPIVVVRVAPSPPDCRPHLVRGKAMIRVNATTRPASPTQLRNLTAGGS